MKIISKEETSAWVTASLGCDLTSHSLTAEFPYRSTYLLPADSGKKTALARAIANSIDPAPSGLFWITSHGVWPSSENMDLFEGYRSYLGETKPLFDAPGHVFDKTDLAALQTLLGISLYFFWDAVLIEGTMGLVVRFSHDECMDIYAKDQGRFRAIDGCLTKMDMKRSDEKSV